MTFYVQHGYGKGQKIPDVMSGGHLAGVILSPGDEDSGPIGDTARYCRSSGLDVLVDPQTYMYSTQPPGRGRNHEGNGLLFPRLSWAQDAQSVAAFVHNVGKLNAALAPEGRWIAPGPLQDSFTDLWTPLSVQLARTASQEWGSDRTLATLAVEESGLASWAEIERWLDVATTLPVRGFYILVSRPSTVYPPVPWAPAKLANLLRLIHVLGVLNEYEVTWGYSDFDGLLGLAAGAQSMAAGWSYTLRQFSSTKWMSPSTGGRPATVRTHLERLWSLPKAEPETSPLFDSALREELFTESEISLYEEIEFDELGRPEAQVDHLRALANSSDRVSSQPTHAERVQFVLDSLENAIRLFAKIDGTGALLEPAYKNRVLGYRDGLRMYIDQVAF